MSRLESFKEHNNKAGITKTNSQVLKQWQERRVSKKNMWFFFPVFSIPWYLLRLPRRVLTLDSNLSWLPLPAGTQTTSLPYIVLQSQASPMDQCDLPVTELASSLITQFQIYLQLKGKKRILFLLLGWYTMMSFVTNPFFLFARCVQTEGVHIA